jgi:methyl-accepting chemotaxis protein
MKTFVIVAFSVLLAACSYEFSQPPFQEDELTKITKSEFGKEILSHIENFPSLEEIGNPEENLTEADLVYVVADDFVIQQNEKDGSPGWELTVWTKNAHHIISCSLMQDENFAIDKFDVETLEDGTIYLKGSTEELKRLAIQLSLTAPKLCVSVPYADASDVIDLRTEYKNQTDRLTTDLDTATNAKTEYKNQIDQLTTDLDTATNAKTEYKNQIDRLTTELDTVTNAITEYSNQTDRLTTELDTATNAKTEYKNQIDRLTTELDTATNAMSRERGKIQDLQKLNQQLDEELSSSNTRSLQILVIALVIVGIGAVTITIIAVRSRLRRTGRQQ